jgi:hypothetical protein
MTDTPPRSRSNLTDGPRLAPVRYALVASQAYPQANLVRAFIHALPDGSRIVCGSAGEAGAAISRSATKRGHSVSTVIPGTRHPRFPTGVREFDLVDLVEVVVAFWDGECRRTGAVVDRAFSRERRLWIADSDGHWTFHCEPGQHMRPVSQRGA